jgi:hypothetical protein
VVSYLRLVVSPRFACRRAALAQLVTGLSISILATVRLFLVMQMTGRVRWSEVLGKKPAGTGAATAP